MRTKLLMAAAALLLTTSGPARAAGGHGAALFHGVVLEAAYGGTGPDPLAAWDLDGWIGGDIHKLRIKSEGGRADGATEEADVSALYSRNVSPFWDLQAGVRRQVRPTAASYAVLGVEGLAPYFLETEAHLFLSDDGDLSARLHGETEFLLTQQAVLQPYAEAHLFAQDVGEQGVGAGLATAKAGLQFRYEVTRKLAPYLDLHYERAFAETGAIRERHGEDKGDGVLSVGLRLMF